MTKKCKILHKLYLIKKFIQKETQQVQRMNRINKNKKHNNNNNNNNNKNENILILDLIIKVIY